MSVRVVTRSLRLTDLEENLAATIGTSTGAGAGLRHCEQACRDAWDAAAGSRTMVLIRSTEGAATRRIDVNRRLRTSAITKLTTAVERVGRVGLAQGEDLMSRLESTP